MSENQAKSTVLLAEANSDLREIEELILTDAGFGVTVLPPQTDPVSFATATSPDVIVIHVGHGQPFRAEIVDQFQANPATEKIPIVAISMTEPTAAQVQAAPNVSESVVAPFDIAALEAAVATALGHPPPAAILPEASGLVPPGVAVAGGALANNVRAVVLRTVERLRRVEPYRTRFSELSTGLVDAMGEIIGSIAIGLQRGLTPEEVFSVPAVEQTIDEHVQLRQQQKLGLASVIREDQLLKDEMDAFLQGMVGQGDVSAEDALGVSRRIQSYCSALIRMIIQKYEPNGSTDYEP